MPRVSDTLHCRHRGRKYRPVRNHPDRTRAGLVSPIWNPRHDDPGRAGHHRVAADAAAGLDSPERPMKTLYRYRNFILGPIIIAEAFLLPPKPFFKELQIAA